MSMITFSFKLPEDDLSKLGELAEQKGLTKATVMRRLLRSAIKTETLGEPLEDYILRAVDEAVKLRLNK